MYHTEHDKLFWLALLAWLGFGFVLACQAACQTEALFAAHAPTIFVPHTPRIVADSGFQVASWH
jgi:uncharacterized membrane protein YedE/YeeE